MYREEHDAGHAPAAAPPAGAREKSHAEGRRAAHELTATSDWRAGRPGPYVFVGRSMPPGPPREDDDDGETQIESTAGGDA